MKMIFFKKLEITNFHIFEWILDLEVYSSGKQNKFFLKFLNLKILIFSK